MRHSYMSKFALKLIFSLLTDYFLKIKGNKNKVKCRIRKVFAILIVKTRYRLHSASFHSITINIKWYKNVQNSLK